MDETLPLEIHEASIPIPFLALHTLSRWNGCVPKETVYKIHNGFGKSPSQDWHVSKNGKSNLLEILREMKGGSEFDGIF